MGRKETGSRGPIYERQDGKWRERRNVKRERRKKRGGRRKGRGGVYPTNKKSFPCPGCSVPVTGRFANKPTRDQSSRN